MVMDPNFSFPFQPYDIQKQFMTELYFTIQDKKLGIFESPTGTGKSLSICCSALQWLKDTNLKTVEELTNQINKLKLELKTSTGTDDWLQEEYEKLQKNQLIATLQLKLDKIKHREEEFVELKKRVARHKTSLNKIDHPFIKHNKNNETSDIKDYEEKENIEDQDLIVDEIQIEDNESDGDEPCVDEEKDSGIKIYISSRTHSQLSQFVGEIKKTVFNNNTRVVTLASRQHFCINSDVTKLKHVNLINERCLDMQKSKSKSTSTGEEGKVVKRSKTLSCAACPYYNQTNITKLKERMLVDIMDMEDIVKCGKQLKACPYYASRMALDDAEVILISHAGIVSGGARSGVSLKLQDNVVILDEAHGLSAALEGAHCAPVARRQLGAVRASLQVYTDRYRARLSSRSLLLLNQLHFVVGKLLGLLKPKTTSDKEGEAKIFSLEDFVIQAEIDHLHLRPLVEFCRNTRLAPKLHGFSMRYSQHEIQEENKKVEVNRKASFKEFLNNIAKKKDHQEVVDMQNTETKTNQTHNLPTETSAGSGLYAILDFLEMLCDRSENGRVFAQRGDAGQLKYLLLNPAEHFAEVVKQCRSVIVAGGTMEPVAEFRALLAHDSPEAAARVHVVKCAHVVSPRNVLAACVARGPSNAPLNFSYENRSTEFLLKEVGGILRNVCALVPGGVVCFLPSYSYELLLYEHLRTGRVLDTIAKRKRIFREPKSAADVDQVLQKYAAAIKSKETPELNGALLLSVVGGKLSEGLNFSDDLGRCVIVIGMPYPNVKSLELQEKLNYLNQATPGAGSVYYENLCMKAVNQCIGRAVRHANDYACVLLVDERYSRPQTVAALPSFVQKSLLANCTFGQTIGSIAKFFASHKEDKT